MPLWNDSLGLPDSGFVILRDLIHERTGMFYENGKSEILTEKLSPLVIERGFKSFLDYYYLLKYDPHAGNDWKQVIDALSVQETYFWREIDQVHALVDVLVPQHFSQPGTKPMRIWSAACATGEEPLTIAMALNEKGWFNRAPIELYASDASAAAVAKARKGVYRERSFRSLAPGLRARYFTEDHGYWQVDQDLQARIQWSVANLMAESDIALLSSADVVFCRNVFIYFSRESVRKVAAIFARRMTFPGYLLVGASESLLRLTDDFDFQEIGGAFVYATQETRNPQTKAESLKLILER